MPDLKLLRIERGDGQKNLADKLNKNFSDVIGFGGGPYGPAGEIGSQGDQGETGPVGSYGSLGPRGSIWNVGPTQPSPTGGIDGDFWIDTADSNNVYNLSSGSWNSYGFNLLGQDLFRISSPVKTTLGDSSYSGYYISSINPEKYTLALSDNVIGDGSAFANPQYSKVVISIDGGATGKNLMEFTKANVVNNTAFTGTTPRFFWTDRSTTNYNLSFRSGGSLLKSISGNLTLQSKAQNYNVNLNSTGLNLNLNSSLRFTARSLSGNILLDFKTSGTASFSTRNITYSSSLFNMPVNFFLYSSTTDTIPPLWLSNASPSVGGFRHRVSVTSNRSTRLFRAYDIASAAAMFEVLGDGEVYYNRKVESIQPSQSVAPKGTGLVYIGPSSTVSVNWYSVIPTIAITSSVSNSVNCNNGTDFVITPTVSGPSSAAGVYLWTPATGGGLNTNPGWLNLLNSTGEAINVKVRTDSESKLIRFVGLGLGQTYDVLPYGNYVAASGNGVFADLSGNSATGASNIDFTIVNVFGSSGSNVQGSTRWFKVYYSAYGGNLDSVKCGVLYSQVFVSSYINSGSIFMTNSFLTQTAPATVTLLSSGTPITPGLSRVFSGLFNSGTSLSAIATFATAPRTVTATLTLYPSRTVINGSISGTGTSRTVTWTSVNLSTTFAYEVRIGGS
jgi:hypothetical protein